MDAIPQHSVGVQNAFCFSRISSAGMPGLTLALLAGLVLVPLRLLLQRFVRSLTPAVELAQRLPQPTTQDHAYPR